MAHYRRYVKDGDSCSNFLSQKLVELLIKWDLHALITDKYILQPYNPELTDL